MNRRFYIVCLLCCLCAVLGFFWGRLGRRPDSHGRRGARYVENLLRGLDRRASLPPAAGRAGAGEKAAPRAASDAGSAVAPAAQAAAPAASGGGYLEGELILRPKEGASMALLMALLKERGIAVEGDLRELNMVRVVLPEDLSVPEAEKLMREVDEVADTVRNAPVSLEPGPEDLAEQMARCTPVGSSALALMSGTEIATGRQGEGVLVAVLDTGVDPDHPCLMGRVFGGYDFVGDMGYQVDGNGHGTACASLIAGTGAAGGVRGPAPRASILPVKVMDDSGKSDGFSIAEGIVYAVKEKAKIINLSLGTTSETTLLDAAVDYALDHGVLVVAAAGNEGKEGENYPSNREGVLCAGAVDGAGWKAPFSNYGPRVDLVAPGVMVAAAAPGGGTVLMSGTSSAAPLVCGAAASVWSDNLNFTAGQVAERLMACADDLGAAGPDDWYGAGLVDLHRALRRGEEDDLALTSLFFDPPELYQGSEVTMVAVFQNQGTGRILDGKVEIRTENGSESLRLPNLEPGESTEVRQRIRIPLARVKRELTLEIQGQTSREDARPSNNGRRITISE